MAYDVLIDWKKVQRQKTLNSQLDLLFINHRELTELEVRAVVQLTGRQAGGQIDRQQTLLFLDSQ